MKKRILFVMSQFNMGGIEKELLCLFEQIDRSRYDVALCLTGRGGQLESALPDYVAVSHMEKNIRQETWKQVKQRHFWRLSKKLYYYLRLKVARSVGKDYWAARMNANNNEAYDCVIAYDGLDMAVIGLAEETNARKKVLWEHGPLIGVDDYFCEYSKRAAKRFNKVICVSKSLKKEFEEMYHLPEGKCSVIYNLINVPELLCKAEEPVTDMNPPTGKCLVTVGRLHPQKGTEMIPKIAQMLVDAGFDIYWYLIGDGILRTKVEQMCRELQIEDRVILLGTKENPFPYIKNCDLYVQTSAWEGWCLTVQEARILCKPMVVTPLPVLQEQIESEKNGLIAESVTPEGIFKSIKRLLEQPQWQERFTMALGKENHETCQEIEKLYEIIENHG